MNPHSPSITDAIFLEAVQAASAHIRPPAVEKTSAPREPSPQEKLSHLKSSAEEARQMGFLLEQLGAQGFQKISMQKIAASGAAPPVSRHMDASPKRPTEPIEGQPGPTDSNAHVAGSQPATAQATRGNAPPQLLKDPANRATMATSETDDAGREYAGVHGGGTKDLADGSDNLRLDALAKQSSARLRHMTGGKFVPGQTKQSAMATLQAMGIAGPTAALQVFENTARRYKTSASILATQWGLNSPDKGELLRKVAAARYSTKVSSLEGDISTAKKAVESLVKATGELPEAAQIAEAAGVDPVAANIAIYEVAELVAATGGQVGSAGAPPPSGAPANPDAGAPAGGPPPMPPGPPMGPPPEGAMGPPPGAMPPGPPPGMGGPPPGMGGPPPGMMGMAGAGATKVDLAPSDLRSTILKVASSMFPKVAASPELGNREESTAGSGIPSPREMQEDPHPSGGTVIDTSAKGGRDVDRVLASNASAMGAGYDGLEHYRAEKKDTQVGTSTKNPGTKGLLSSKEPVKSTFEGDLGPSSAGEGTTPGGHAAPSGSVEQKLSADLARLRAELDAARGESSVRADVKGLFGKASAGESDPVRAFVEDFIRTRSATPSIADIVQHTGLAAPEAQKALASILGQGDN